MIHPVIAKPAKLVLKGVLAGQRSKQQINKTSLTVFVETDVVLLPCGCLSLIPFIEFSIRNNSSSSDVLNIQASISISPKFESK